MEYRAFTPPQKRLRREFKRNHLKEDEIVLRKFYFKKNVVVEDYISTEGALVQVESSLEGNATRIPDNSRILNLRLIGSPQNVREYLKRLPKFKEIKVFAQTDIGKTSAKELEEIIAQGGFVIKHEFGLAHIIDPTRYL